MEISLTNCPFCGGHPMVTTSGVAWRVRCEKCHAEGGVAFDQDEALALWNKRGGMGNARVSLVRPDVPVETFKYVERLRELADRVERGELGTPTCGVVVHFNGAVAAVSELRIGATAASALMKQVANGY